MNVAQAPRVGNVLIVEDEVFSLALLRRLFPAGTYSTSAAGTASEALDLIKKHEFDVGIFDLRIPFELDDVPTSEQALEVLRAARARQPNMSIITISSVFIDDNVRLALQDLGVLKNFEKPFSFPKLHDEVDAYLPH